MSAATERHIDVSAMPSRWPFLAQEYLRIMRGRLAMLIWAVLIYSVAGCALSDGKTRTRGPRRRGHLAGPASGQ